jgi:hypothetical protein
MMNVFTIQDYKLEEDPSKFKSTKTDRGPLEGGDWDKRIKPVMCCYKLVTVEFKWWGLQGKIEKFIHRVCCGSAGFALLIYFTDSLVCK